MRYYEDPILGKGRAADVSGGTGSADYVGGTRIAIAGETISFVNSATIQNVTGTSVTLEPDTAYKITATASAVTLNANVPEAGKWAYEGHAEIFVAGTGYIVTGANVVLANPLEPDAVNNCVLRFHDGTCIIDVEDHVYGYVVTSISGTTQGTLPYGITSATSNYIAFDATTNGSIIDLSGSTASAEKHLVGNGYTSTTLTGAVDCGTSKFTVANLSLSDVQVTGGTMTLGDAWIPSGSTVAVSGGGLAVEKVTGNGGVIELSGENTRDIALITGNARTYMSGVTFLNGGGKFGGALQISGGMATINDCTFSNCKGEIGAAIHITGSGAANINYINDCVFEDNGTVTSTADVTIFNRSVVFDGCIFNRTGSGSRAFALTGTSINVSTTVSNCQIAKNIYIQSAGVIDFSGSNSFVGTVTGGTGTVNITSGAILDLTGNTNATPINPGGGIVFEAGGATVLYSSGAVSGSYMMDNVTLPAGAKLTNTAVVDLGGKHAVVPSATTASASGCMITGGKAITSAADGGGAFDVYAGGSLTLLGVTLTGNSAYYGGGVRTSGTLHLSNTTVSGNVGLTYNTHDIFAQNASVYIDGGCVIGAVVGPSSVINIGGSNAVEKVGGNGASAVISSGASINLTSSINPGGGITVLTGGCTVNGNAIPAGTYTSIDSNGQPT